MHKVILVGGVVAGWEAFKRLIRGIGFYGKALDAYDQTEIRGRPL